MSEAEMSPSDTHMPCCSRSAEGGHCPMAARFEATIGGSGFQNGMFVVGLLFVLLGVVILIWPVVIVWFTAIVSILIGISFMSAASMFRKLRRMF